MTDQTDPLLSRLRHFFAAEEFEPGERLGSERALAEHFAVTRSELRTALDELERTGQVRRTIGRSGGVFRWDGRIERHLNTLEGIPEMLRQQGFRSRTVVLHAGIALASPAEQRALRLEDGEPVFRLRRRRDADDSPFSLDSMSLSLRLFPGFGELDHTTSVYRHLLDRYGVEAAEADEVIDTASADSEQAELLGIEVGAPLLAVRRVTFSQAGIPFEFAHDFFIAERTRVTLRRHGSRWKRAGVTRHS